MTDAHTMWSNTDSLLSFFLSVSLSVRGVVQLHKNPHRFLGYAHCFVCASKGARERYHDDGIRNQPYIEPRVCLSVPSCCVFFLRWAQAVHVALSAAAAAAATAGGASKKQPTTTWKWCCCCEGIDLFRLIWTVFIAGHNAAERITAEQGSCVRSLAGRKEDLERERDLFARDINVHSEVSLTSFLEGFSAGY